MKKILILTAFMLGIGHADAAVRDGTSTVRRGATPSQQRVSTTVRSDNATPRQSVLAPRTGTQPISRNTTTTRNTNTAKGAPKRTTTSRSAIASPTVSRAGTAVQPRSATPVSARAATAESAATQTRTGADYEKCKAAYFTCMDQFCQLKNDDYRRCSCSNRIYDLDDARTIMQQAGEQLTVFTENLDVVGMTSAQATAMRTASEGENALTSDKSASKALLQAIMNSIRGGDTNVGGKYSDLNSINISFDTTNAFGTMDAGQTVATYNGQDLYSAVYPQCRNAVRADCNDAALQRAVNAYLMAIEQDCNTVQTAIETKQKEMKSAVREGSALLDLARVENRQKHNSDDISTCIANVETAILSEEVCGAGYHKCLDNGKFIDITTGKPIAGVVRFYELEKLLTFSDGVDAAQQKLSTLNSNKAFVQSFESRTKKFAAPALDKCTEQADVVWAEYLDKALLDIYYAQKAKVSEIKQGCFDFVSTCYMNGDNALTAAMKELVGDASIVLQPDRVALNSQLCKDYVESCNNMFDGNIIAQYIDNRQQTDTLAACRAVVKQCFDKFGGNGFENLYYPYSGLTTAGSAANWFTLYEIKYTDKGVLDKQYKSECAKQLQNIAACSDPEMIEQAFGGFDMIQAGKGQSESGMQYYMPPYKAKPTTYTRYGLLANEKTNITPEGADTSQEVTRLRHRELRPTGVATEVYNQIIDILTTQCTNLQGRFVEMQFIKDGLYDNDNFCIATFADSYSYDKLINIYGIAQNENMCPRNYSLGVDTQSWGACLCWENGGRRSKNGQSAKCTAVLPITEAANDANCYTDKNWPYSVLKPDSTDSFTGTNWCTQTIISTDNQVCPIGASVPAGKTCEIKENNTKIELTQLPAGLI